MIETDQLTVRLKELVRERYVLQDHAAAIAADLDDAALAGSRCRADPAPATSQQRSAPAGPAPAGRRGV